MLEKTLIIMLPVLISWVSLSSQSIEELYPEAMAEKYAERAEEFTDPEQIQEYLDATGKKINLNSSNKFDLNKIDGLNPEQIRNLLDYREKYGPFLSTYELKHIPGFDPETIRKILPCIVAEQTPELPAVTLQNLVMRGKNKLTFRYRQVLETRSGFMDGTYRGTPQSYYLRYNWEWYNRFSAGISAEKSAGEQFFRGAQKSGFDYYALYLALNNFKWIKTIVAGNYTTSFGQGLTLGSGFTGVATGFTPAFIYRQGIRPSLSTYAAGNLKGIGAAIVLKRMTISTFYSNRRRDGSVTDSTVESLTLSGLHRTESEIIKRGTVREQLFGGNVSFAGNFFRLGLTGYHVTWDPRIEPGEKPYERFDFRGKSSANLGMDYLIRLPFTTFFGEISKSVAGGLAWLGGICLEPFQGASLTIMARDYSAEYRNLFTSAIGQASGNSNEEGIFIQLNCKPLKKVDIYSYADIYRFPWLRYRVNSPSLGSEAGFTAQWNISDKACVISRYTWTHQEQNDVSSSEKIHPVEIYNHSSVRLISVWQPFQILKLRTTFEIKGSPGLLQSSACGTMASQDIQLIVVNGAITASLKYILFDIPDYGLRIYSYEPDVMYSISVPALEGRGFRVGVMVRANVNRKCTMWLRYSMVHYSDRIIIGSGSETIEGRNKSDLTAQLRVSL